MNEAVRHILKEVFRSTPEKENECLKLIDQQNAIERKMRAYQQDKSDWDKSAKVREKELAERLRIIQGECPHVATTYYGDAAGGSDSSTVCNTCGKEVGR